MTCDHISLDIWNSSMRENPFCLVLFGLEKSDTKQGIFIKIEAFFS